MPVSNDDDPKPIQGSALTEAALLYAGLTGACLVTLAWVVSEVLR